MQDTDTQGQLSDEIQGNILRGYSFGHARFAFLEIQSAQDGRDWLAKLPVTSGGAWTSPPNFALNVALSHRGLAKLGIHAQLLGQFSQAFQTGMQGRRAQLGDPDDLSAWDDPFKSKADRIHVLVSLYGNDPVDLDSRLQQVTNHAGVQLLQPVQQADSLDGREHFGFRDGISQPIQKNGSGGWISAEGVPVRDFLLFESNWNGGQGTASAKGLQLGRLGTYLVYRKLEQDVPRFRSFVKGWTLPADTAAAKLVGRWPDGTPLTKKPDGPSALPADHNDNDFDFIDTGDLGQKCPYGAHISRANPRRRLPAGSNDHRILRRGLPYGKPLLGGWLEPFDGPVPVGDTAERGLIFVCLNASIEKQFEFLQRGWLNEPSFNGLDGADPLANSVGPGELGNFRAAPQFPPWPLETFIELKGGEYFFVPSMEALGKLAAGEFSTP
jgi:Dyp-type peroxidase family